MAPEQNDITDIEISPETVREKLLEDEDITLVDIRTPRERDHVRIDGDEWIEMNQVPDKVTDLSEKDRPIVIYCHHGQRSLKVARFLDKEGIDEVFSMAGGIDYWARNINEDLPTY